MGDALRALPVADLLFNERGEWSEHLNVYVDGLTSVSGAVSRLSLRTSAKCVWSA